MFITVDIKDIAKHLHFIEYFEFDQIQCFKLLDQFQHLREYLAFPTLLPLNALFLFFAT